MCLIRRPLPMRNRLFLALGMLCLLSSTLLRRLYVSPETTDFWQGFCLGLGIVLTLSAIVLNCYAMRPPRANGPTSAK